jgi:hypothetical protein
MMNNIQRCCNEKGGGNVANEGFPLGRGILRAEQVPPYVKLFIHFDDFR